MINNLIFYVGKDGKKTFVNDPSAVKAFRKHGIEISNSSDKVEVVQMAEGNYQVREITSESRDKNSGGNESDQRSVLVWIVAGFFVFGLGYFILKRRKKRNERETK